MALEAKTIPVVFGRGFAGPHNWQGLINWQVGFRSRNFGAVSMFWGNQS